MRILALTSSYPKFEGDPTAPFVESITRAVASLGHEVHLVVPVHREWRRPPVEDGIYYHTYRYSPVRHWTPWGYSEALTGTGIKRELYALAPAVYASALRTCRRLTVRADFDVVHAHWVVPNGVIAARVSRGHNTPLVVSLHGSDVTLAERKGLVGKLARRSLAFAEAVTAPSQHLLQRAQSLGVIRGTLELAPYGVDTAEFRPDRPQAAGLRARLGLLEGDVVVLGIGRLVPVKGFAYLIEAIAEARRTTPRVRLVLAGDGDLRHELETKVRDLGLNEAVVFVGAVSRSEAPDYFAAADIVAVPSLGSDGGFVEAFGNVALEALAAGKPVVVSRVGGLPELVRDGETGLLVPQRDAGALSRAIEQLAPDESARRAMGERARLSAERSLTWHAAAERMVSLYEKVV